MLSHVINLFGFWFDECQHVKKIVKKLNLKLEFCFRQNSSSSLVAWKKMVAAIVFLVSSYFVPVY